jgi:GAF domain-containing protein
MYGFESYISLPIRRTDGSFFGTLCALDPEPRRLDAETIGMLEAFAELIGLQIEPDRPVAAPAA